MLKLIRNLHGGNDRFVANLEYIASLWPREGYLHNNENLVEYYCLRSVNMLKEHTAIKKAICSAPRCKMSTLFFNDHLALVSIAPLLQRAC